jgi:hypothetical protein
MKERLGLATDDLSKTRLYDIDIDLLQRTVMDIALPLFAVTLGMADAFPVGRLIAGPFKPGRIHKGFYKP